MTQHVVLVLIIGLLQVGFGAAALVGLMRVARSRAWRRIGVVIAAAFFLLALAQVANLPWIELGPAAGHWLQQHTISVAAWATLSLGLGLVAVEVRGSTRRLTTGVARERQFAHIVGATADAMLVVNREGDVRFANRAAERLFQATPGELVGTPFGYPIVAGTVAQIDVVSPRGRRIAEMSTVAMTWEGKPALLATVHDVTAREGAARALRSAEERSRNLISTMGAAFLLLERVTPNDGPGNLVIVRANPAFHRLIAHHGEVLPGRLLADLESVIPSSWAARFAAVANGGKPAQFRDVLGQQHVRVAAYAPAEGECAVIIHDVTAEHVVDQRRLMFERLEAFAQVGAGLAHDLNNHLAVILGNAQLLADTLQEATPEAREDLARLGDAAASGAELVRQLLASTRQETLRREVMDLGTLVERIVPMIRRLIPSNIEVTATCARSLPAVSVDPMSVQRMLLNLAANARDAMPTGGRFTVAVSATSPAAHAERNGGAFVCVSATDTGCGMPDDVKARVFEPFFTTKARGKGTGLGLAMIQGLLQQHGGLVELESAVGHGTTVRLYFPATDEAPALATPQAVPRAPVRPRVVLFVDDQEALRRTGRRVLETAGCRVLDAANGEEALTLFRRHVGEVEVVVSDMVMPGISGLELLTQIRHARPEIRVVLSTGYAEADLAGGPGPTDVTILRKPWSIDDLLGAVFGGQ